MTWNDRIIWFSIRPCNMQQATNGYQVKRVLYEAVSNYDIQSKWYVYCISITIYTCNDGILPKGPYQPCQRMADRALLAGYPGYIKHLFVSVGFWLSHLVSSKCPGNNSMYFMEMMAGFHGSQITGIISFQADTKQTAFRQSFSALPATPHFD